MRSLEREGGTATLEVYNGYGAPQGGPPPGYGGGGGGGYGGPPQGGGYGPPQGGYGPPQSSYGARPPDKGTSVMAILSFVFAILSTISCCVGGFLLAPLGLLFSFVGIAATGSNKKSGRWMAVIGLIVNLLWTLAIGAMFALGGAGIMAVSKEVGKETETILTQLQDGQVDTVWNEATEQYRASHSIQDLQGISDQIKGLGKINSVDLDWKGTFEALMEFGQENPNHQQTAGENFMIMRFNVSFAQGTKVVTVALRQIMGGRWNLVDLKVS